MACTDTTTASTGKDVLEVAAEAAVDKKGWRIFDGKVLLCQATKKYKKMVTLHAGHAIPWNETAEFYEPGGADHWFEVGPLSTADMVAETGMYISGRLFTTRMPQGLDLQPGDYKGEVASKHTDKRRFIQTVKDNQIKCAIVLVSDEEMTKGESSDLLGFYKSLGIDVHHTVIKDFTVPSFELENNNIELLSSNLAKGVNCLVHCWGGSGRTGTVVVGALHNFGISRPIKVARKAKSVYLDIKEQEDFVEKQRLVINEQMMKECPALVHDRILGHFNSLCGLLDHPTAKYVATEGTEEGETEKRALMNVFNTIDVHGHSEMSVRDKYQFVEKMRAGVPDKTFVHITENSLQKLYGRFDAAVLSCDVDQDSIGFDLFHKVLCTNVTTAHDAEANLKVDSGFA